MSKSDKSITIVDTNTARTTPLQTQVQILEIEVISKKQHEKVLRKNKQLTQQVKDLKNIIQLMRLRQGYVYKFVSDYLKPRHRPRYDDANYELWSKDGKHYYKINRSTLETDYERHKVITGRLEILRRHIYQ